MDTADVIVVGGGVVGLAIARSFAKAKRNVMVFEQHDRLATETSSRNSEVIHAGLYYPPGSRKARTCIAGNAALYRYCAKHNVTTYQCGKLVVAQTEDDIEVLEKLIANARACGVHDLVLYSKQEVEKREPALDCAAACFSPSTGVIDSHGFAAALEADVLAQDGVIVTRTTVTGLTNREPNIEVETRDPSGARYTLTAVTVINAAGLNAQLVSQALLEDGITSVPNLHYGKGHYFDYTGNVPFSHLIYPLPTPGSLGIHLTRSADGMIRFGPDLDWVEKADYTFNDADGRRKQKFVAAIRRYWPEVAEDKLHPGTTGVRPKLVGSGAPPADFVIHGPNDHGAPGFYALYGIESPGLTASLALADEVCRLAHGASN